MDATLLITRGLNHLQRQYVPSYLGLRVFAESTAKSVRSEWTNGYIARRSYTKRRQAYWKYSGVKGQDEHGHLEYRHFVVGSPTTMLSECHVISQLAQWSQFTRHPSVYSYLWPFYKNSSHLFSHFIYGYRRRERDVAEVVQHNPNHICIVLDLRSFYPSVDKAKVQNRFSERIKRVEATSAEKDAAIYVAQQLLDFPETGLPVGPPLSHVLANVALENVDREMSGLYPGMYFRYVDDVVVVVEQDKVEAAMRQFRALIAGEGLAVNDSKTDTVAASNWKDHVVRRETHEATDSFASLIRRLHVYCARSPEKWEATKRLFRESGFSLPFSRLRSVVEYGRFRRFVKVLWKSTKWADRISYWYETPQSLLQLAQDIRANLLDRATAAVSEVVPDSGMLRRWRISELRFTFARLLYLLPFSEYGQLLDLLPSVPECGELRVMLTALRTGDATELLVRPGPSVSTFAQLWKENATTIPRIRWSDQPSYFERDSAVALATYGILPLSEEWIARMPNITNRQLLQISSGRTPEPFRPDTPEYLRELDALRQGWSSDELERLLRDRFNNDEDVPLFGLEIGGGYFS